jgi:hypothetical protein
MFISALNFFWLSEEHHLQAIGFPPSKHASYVFCEEGARLVRSIGENYCPTARYPYSKVIGTLPASPSSLSVRGSLNCHDRQWSSTSTWCLR